MFYAHSVPDRPESDWEPWEKHASEVAALAAEFAGAFDAATISYVAGALHDLGKIKPAFQGCLQGGPRAPHSGEGARKAVDIYGQKIGRMLALAIAGHHAGLANGTLDSGGTLPLDTRLRLAEAVSIPDGIDLPLMPSAPPNPIADGRINDSFATSFFVRMIFSCLVDADRLATECFYQRFQTEPPVGHGWGGNLSELRAALDAHLAKFGKPTSEIDRLRSEVLSAARAASACQPGLFTFTVPTGGGKTLSALAFALDHAIEHGLRRIVYVAPFTAIIEQTASVFHDALNDTTAILEHHSAFDIEERRQSDEGGEDEGVEALRKATENWDRPVIVTTAVQLFESLFSGRPSRCRKLHRLARSVIVLDEAQSLPLHVLRPCLAALNELARGYGASVVLCTATQPAVRAVDGFKAPEALSIDTADG